MGRVHQVIGLTIELAEQQTKPDRPMRYVRNRRQDESILRKRLPREVENFIGRREMLDYVREHDHVIGLGRTDEILVQIALVDP
jgi:hypothetical protein